MMTLGKINKIKYEIVIENINSLYEGILPKGPLSAMRKHGG